MKKLFGVLLVVAFLFASPFALGEGTKTLVYDETLKVTVPEMAPEFFGWPPQLMGGKDYPNGRSVAVFETWNPSETVFVTVLILHEPDGSIHVLSLGVSYLLPEFFQNPSPKYVVTEYYEDLSFGKTNKPSDTLVRVKDPTPWEVTDSHLGRILVKGEKI